MKFTRLGSHGFTHFIVPALVILAVAGIGTWLFAFSHAASFPSQITYGTGSGDKNYNPGNLTLVSGSSKLIFQSDSNLVLYFGSKALWASGTSGQPRTHLDLASNGNMIIWQLNARGGGYTALWSSGTGFGNYCNASRAKIASYTLTAEIDGVNTSRPVGASASILATFPSTAGRFVWAVGTPGYAGSSHC